MGKGLPAVRMRKAEGPFLERKETMIKHMRIDERMIHGQVASVWTNFLGCTRIIVANDEAPKSEMQIAALKLACPAGVKLSILSVGKAAANILAGKYDADKVFLITRSVPDCKRLVDAGVPLPGVNVGNLAHHEGLRKIKKSVSLSEDDIGQIREIIAKGIPVTAQMIPDESDASIETFLK